MPAGEPAAAQEQEALRAPRPGVVVQREVVARRAEAATEEAEVKPQGRQGRVTASQAEPGMGGLMEAMALNFGV